MTHTQYRNQKLLRLSFYADKDLKLNTQHFKGLSSLQAAPLLFKNLLWETSEKKYFLSNESNTKVPLRVPPGKLSSTTKSLLLESIEGQEFPSTFQEAH